MQDGRETKKEIVWLGGGSLLRQSRQRLNASYLRIACLTAGVGWVSETVLIGPFGRECEG